MKRRPVILLIAFTRSGRSASSRLKLTPKPPGLGLKSISLGPIFTLPAAIGSSPAAPAPGGAPGAPGTGAAPGAPGTGVGGFTPAPGTRTGAAPGAGAPCAAA